MAHLPYLRLVEVKCWADHGLCDAIRAQAEKLDDRDMAILVQILDHIHVVDRIFQHHLLGRAHGFAAARSETPPPFDELAQGIAAVDDWYRSHVARLTAAQIDEPVDFTFTSGRRARMRRGEMVLHVAQHGTYHRGNAGALLQLRGLDPAPDSITDYLAEAA